MVWVLCVALLVAPLSALRAAVGTVTVTTKKIFGNDNITQYTVSATSSAGGAVSANPFSVVPGEIYAVKFVPCSGGTQPSDLSDATLVDANSIDLLDGQGANLSNSAGAYVQFTTPFYFPGSGASQTLDLVWANAGNAKCMVVTLWVR